MGRRSAFTLIELLVVISIIAILAGMLMPAISMVKTAARSTACSNHMRQLSLSVIAYAGSNDSQLPPARFQSCAPADMGFVANSTVSWYHPLLVGQFIEGPVEITSNFIPGNTPFPALFRCSEDRKRNGSSASNEVSYGLNHNIAPYADNAGGIPGMWSAIKSLGNLRRSADVLMLAETHEPRWYPYGGLPGVWPLCPLYDNLTPTSWTSWPAPNSTFGRHRRGANFVYVDGHTGWIGDLTAELTAKRSILGRTNDY
jgi:prepilin-type N-terminal cleavage/methylation domain-containing protein/prepilin-type processing-associated H-X9-DG protein